MTPVQGAIFGLVFLGLAFASTFLMYYLWGFPFDKSIRKSSAPRWLMLVHRAIGYTYALLYIYMMSKMVPRMWEYQVELPPRTVAHLLLGFTIGFIIVIKVAIMRFFRHLEEWMPYLGTLLLLCTVLLMGLSVPFAFRERVLANAAAGGDVFSAQNRTRVAEQLKMAELPADVQIDQLASEKSLRRGRDVLLNKCVKCHDLKTILARPRGPNDWFQTVERMGEKPALFTAITEDDQKAVTAYLVAITPDLQKSKKKQREQQEERMEAMADEPEAMAAMGEEAAEAAGEPAEPAEIAAPVEPAAAPDAGVAAAAEPAKPAEKPAEPKKVAAAIDPKKAQAVFNRVCSQCHETSDVDDAPPKSEASCGKLIGRMVENGLTAKPGDLKLVKFYLVNHYVKKSI